MEVITAISFDSPNTSKPKHQAFPRGILSMTAKLLYRVVAVVLVLFAAGHTFGFLSFRPPSAEGLAVLAAMGNVHFALDGGSYSYAGFYTGFGLMVSAYMLFSAFLAWHLGAISSTQPQTIVALAWAFAALQIVCLVLGWLYFFLVPILFSAAVSICSVWAAWLLGKAKA